MPNPQEKTAAAIKIQSVTRGFFARKIPHLPPNELHSYPVFIQGNDPKIRDLPVKMAHVKILIIGTSGLRSLEIACAIGGKLPKILLIDHSQQVIAFWKKVKANAGHSNNQKDFLNGFFEVLSSKQLWETITYLTILCNKFSFDRVKEILTSAQIIPQNWEDKRTFIIIKRLIVLHRYEAVFTYSSNIAAYFYASNQEKKSKDVLQNIELLNPEFAIHTDLGPSRVVLVKKGQHQLENVVKQLQFFSLKSAYYQKQLMPLLFALILLLYYLQRCQGILDEENDLERSEIVRPSNYIGSVDIS